MTREQAKAYIVRHCNPDYPKGKTEWETAINMAISALDQPERKTGHWVKKVDAGVYWYECSECGDYPLKSAFGYDYFSEWCPHCGAKLEGESE